MSEFTTVNLTADTTAGTLILDAPGPKYKDIPLEVMVQAAGTFGSGTLAYLISLDGGTNRTTVKDSTGTAYAATADDIITLSLPVNGAENNIKVYAKLTGSTTPDIDIIPVSNQ